MTEIVTRQGDLKMEQILPWDQNPGDRLLRNEAFVELREHIRTHGQIDPVDVVPTVDPKKYQIVRGNRRYAAMQDLGCEDIAVRIWYLSFEEALALLGPTERMHPNWAGRALGQLVTELGLEQAETLLGPRDTRILRWGRDHLDRALLDDLLTRFGPRFLGRIRTLAKHIDPNLVARAVLLHGSYRELEQKGITIEQRKALVTKWIADAARYINRVA